MLINTFAEPIERLKKKAIAIWEMASEFLREQPGYVSTKLHQLPSPEARYLMVNVAQLESAQAFRSATGLMRKQAILPRIEGAVPDPGLYTRIR
ncbi:MAG: antibiotic biosynthesis monooxygenase [Pseudomonadota bacterium]